MRACMGESWPAVADPPSSVPAFQSTCRTSFSSRRNWAGPGGPHASAASPGCVVPHCGHFRRFGAICHSQPSFWQPFFGCRRGFPLRPLMAARRQQQVQTKTRLATTTSNGPSARGTRRAGTRTRPPVRRSRRAGGGVRGDDPRRRPARDDPRRRGDDPSRPWIIADSYDEKTGHGGHSVRALSESGSTRSVIPNTRAPYLVQAIRWVCAGANAAAMRPVPLGATSPWNA